MSAPQGPGHIATGKATGKTAAAEAYDEAREFWHGALHADGPWSFDWANRPRLGDRVLVTAAMGDPRTLIGEWVGAWTYPITRPAAHEIYYLLLDTGDYLSWSNVTLVRIPRGAVEREEARAQRSDLASP